jgi:hypothetical protein
VMVGHAHTDQGPLALASQPVRPAMIEEAGAEPRRSEIRFLACHRLPRYE